MIKCIERKARCLHHGEIMIEKVVKKRSLEKFSEVKENLAYWLSKTTEERVGAVEPLRKQRHGDSTGLQRTARVIQRASKHVAGNKKAAVGSQHKAID